MSAIARPDAGLHHLIPAFSGELHEPGDAGYDQARMAWNLATDQRPAAVALPRTVADVQAIVAAARERGLRVAPQGTGHNAAPLAGRLEHSVLLKTSLMRDVRIDVLRRTARFEAGALAVEVTAAASPYGLAPVSGSSPDVSLAGFTLGGGIGWLSRKLGLACNNVRAIEVVTADGRHRRCDADNDPELFWALRGGTGSFGVVTAMEIELHPVADLYAGAMLWPWERASEILHAWHAWTREVPDEVTTSARIIQFPPFPDIPEPFRGGRFVVIDGAVMAPEAEAEAIVAPLRALGPQVDLWAVAPPVALSHLHMDPEQPVPGVSDHAMLADLTPEAIDAFVEVGGHESGSPLLIIELRHLGGALGRVPKGAGALCRLAAPYNLFAVGMAPNPDMASAVMHRLELVREAMAPFVTGGAYLNFAERPTATAAAYSEDAYAALQAVKAVFDPQGVIQANHEIPAAG